MIENNDSGNNNIDNIKKIKMVETHIYGRPNGRMSRENWTKIFLNNFLSFSREEG